MPKLPREVYTPEEVQALLAACNGRGDTASRNRALIAVLYRCQARISEALDLSDADIDTAQGIVYIRHGKGDKARTVGIDHKALEYVEAWRAVRADLGLCEAPTLFCTLQGRRMQASYIRALLPRLGRRAGIKKRIHAHGLRHTGACELQAEGVDLGLIRDQLGHTRSSTTDRYLKQLRPERLLETMREREW